MSMLPSRGPGFQERTRRTQPSAVLTGGTLDGPGAGFSPPGSDGAGAAGGAVPCAKVGAAASRPAISTGQAIVFNTNLLLVQCSKGRPRRGRCRGGGRGHA